LGCTDSTACNYDPLANTDDGSCLTAWGCTDSTALNYDPSATCDDGSCTYCVYGCTDSIGSVNYNPLATCDDGSCIAIIYGCTDSTACNFDSLATVDDGSCTVLDNCGVCGGTNAPSTGNCDCASVPDVQHAPLPSNTPDPLGTLAQSQLPVEGALVPPHTPQLSSTVQLPSSTVANESKLHAVESVQP
jgi:hypothetical protein